MGMTINLPRRLIELTDSGTQLLFTNDDSFFYLQVVALVANKMKEQNYYIQPNQQQWNMICQF